MLLISIDCYYFILMISLFLLNFADNKEKAKHTNRHQSELYMILIALGLFGCGIIITIVVLVANEKYHLEDLFREMVVRHWYKCYQNVIKVTKISPSSPKDGTKRIQRLFHEYS